MKQQTRVATQMDYLTAMNPFVGVRRSALGELGAKFSKVFGESQGPIELDPKGSIGGLGHRAAIDLTSAVAFELERFKALTRLKEQQEVEVGDHVAELLATHVEQFILHPPSELRWSSDLHFAYATAFILAIPVVLRNAWLQAGKPPTLRNDVVKEFVTTIKPFICPC